MAERMETVVVGGGQAGLSISYYLTQHGREHLVFERQRVGESWRTGRWDSFTLASPNHMTNLPGFAYSGDDPDGFMPHKGVIEYLEAYAGSFNAPVREGVQVTALSRLPDGTYRIVTSEGDYIAHNVVVATGAYQSPKLPAWSAELPADLLQIHTGQYRNPDALPEGAVLVIGTGQSGCQIGEELYKSGRKVYMSVGGAGRVPRRYRGKDCYFWLATSGFLDRTLDKLPTPIARFAGNPHITGKDGGHTLNLHKFAQEGVTLLGRIRAVDTGGDGDKYTAGRVSLSIDPDLPEKLVMADGYSANIMKEIDEYIANNGIDAPQDPETRGEELRQWELPEVLSELDLRAAQISTIIWGTGYSADFTWVHMPVLDERGFPKQQIVTNFPGLYFLGIPFLPKHKSGLLYGVGEGAEYVAADIQARARHV